MSKECYVCREIKTLDNFVEDRFNKDGRRGMCHACKNKRYFYRRKFEIGRELWRYAKSRCKKSGVEFNISESDIIVPTTCPLLKIPLYTGVKSLSDNSPSLDRIDDSKGYTPDNIWVISYKANRMKSNCNPQDLITFSENILNLYKKKMI